MMKKGGGIVETEEDEGDLGEEERQMRKMQMQGSGDKKANQDLIRETGIGSIGVSALTGGPSGYGGYGISAGYDYGMTRGPQSKIAMLMGFNHLNTIEEEKHETQTSNYFREGDTDRDDSKYLNNTNIPKGSRILDDDM
jgi:hypothetical protein